MKRKNPAAVALGKRKSEKKAAASRANGALGGRPKNPKIHAANAPVTNFEGDDPRQNNMSNSQKTGSPSKLGAVEGSALSFRISDDWERMEITIRGHTLELDQSTVLALHTATGEALGLLAQTIEGQCEACAGPTRGAEICSDCVEDSRTR